MKEDKYPVKKICLCEDDDNCFSEIGEMGTQTQILNIEGGPVTVRWNMLYQCNYCKRVKIDHEKPLDN